MSMIPIIIFIKISFAILALIMAFFGATYVGIAHFNLFPKIRRDLYTIGTMLVVIAIVFITLTFMIL